MTSRIILYCFLLNSLSFQSSAQEILRIHNGCHFDGDDIERELYGYTPSNEAQQIISRITSVMGLEQNFTIKAANVNNALATVEGDERYILYNTAFLEKIKSGSGTYWAAYCVLAHEIGHHLNFHKFSETDPQRRKRMELKADFFAGSTLQKMGASLEEAQAGIETFSLSSESNTHPPKSARLEAVASGWKQAKEGVNFKIETPQYATPKTVDNEQLAKEWYDKGKAEKTDMAKKIEFYSNAIKLKSDYAEAYNNRGWAKDELGKYTEAIADYDKAIRLKPDFALAFNNRGFTKKELGKYTEAIADYDEAIKLDPKYAKPHANKGCALVGLGKYGAAIDSIREAEKIDTIFKTADWVQKCKQEALSKLKD